MDCFLCRQNAAAKFCRVISVRGDISGKPLFQLKFIFVVDPDPPHEHLCIEVVCGQTTKLIVRAHGCHAKRADEALWLLASFRARLRPARSARSIITGTEGGCSSSTWDCILKRFTCACLRKFTLNVVTECERGDLAGVKQRVKARFHLQKRNNIGQQIIHVAAIAGHAKIVRWCVKHPQVHVKATAAQGRTTLWIACFYGHRQVMETLLPFENDISVTPWKGGYAGNTAEQLAKKNHDIDVIGNSSTRPIE